MYFVSIYFRYAELRKYMINVTARDTSGKSDNEQISAIYIQNLYDRSSLYSPSKRTQQSEKPAAWLTAFVCIYLKHGCRYTWAYVCTHLMCAC